MDREEVSPTPAEDATSPGNPGEVDPSEHSGSRWELFA
jgi:hypothetical protein